MPLDTTTSSLTVGTVQCWDEGIVSERFSRNEQVAVRRIRCPWQSRIYVAQQLRGQSFGASYTPPSPYPDAPWLFADQVETVGGYTGVDANGKPTGLQVGVNLMVAYKYAVQHVSYRTLDYLADQQLGSLGLDFATQWISVPSAQAAAFKFATNGNDCLEPPALPLTTVEFVKTVNQVNTLPITKVMTAAASPANSVAFQGAPPGQVIFAGCRSQRQLDTYGQENWNMVYRFKYRSKPWDSAINPAITPGSGTDPFDQLVFKSNGNAIIPRSDLNSLLSA